MKTEGGVREMVPVILLFAAGVFWAGILVAGGGLLLFWAALTCFVSGVVLLGRGSWRFVKPLLIATALFGLTLTVYQIYAALTLIGTGLDPVAGITGALFAVMTVVYLYLLFAGLRKKEA